jgi:formylglycine-generating enzyme required for sulfatase activity
MKALRLWLLAGTLAFFAVNPARAQTPPSLGLQLFAGVNVTGAVGSVYVVQSTTDPGQTNSWTSLAFLQLPTTNYLFVDTTVPAGGNRFYRALLQSPPTNMVYIPPNTFRLGSPTNEIGRAADEGPQTAVTITHGFWMGKYEVTQRDYLAVLGSNPSQFTGDLSRPVETVSWLDATNYCAKLTEQELAAGRIPGGSHYRLPTEAEWEYAARAGTSTRFSYGDDPALTGLTSYAWYAVNSGNMTHPVGQKAPNSWGLYDMEGNVLEWCFDWYGPYPGGFETDPQGPASNAIGVRVIRGGAWDGFETDCRSARRGAEGVSPFIHDFILGFRVVLAAP